MEQFFLYAINSCYHDWKNVFFLIPFSYHNACDHEASTQKSTCHHNHMILRGHVIKQVFYISTCRRLMDIKLYMVLTVRGSHFHKVLSSGRCWAQEGGSCMFVCVVCVYFFYFCFRRLWQIWNIYTVCFQAICFRDTVIVHLSDSMWNLAF